MDELHAAGGVPRGWRFSWPDGDAGRGREVFARLECYQCHEVTDAGFPPVTPDPSRRGPALAGMGNAHPAEYFAESILNPNAVIVAGPGHTGPDGLSIMPDFRDSLTLAETIDLVAYIRSLTGGHEHHHGQHHAEAAPEREQVVGEYRVRITYAALGDEPATHQHPRPGSAAGAANAHLMVFVTDAARGEPVPYLPVTATVHGSKTTPRPVRLSPMLSDRGFHYGATVALPARLTKITIAIGRPLPLLRLTPAESARFAKAVEVSFEWRK
jgi:mono/diheme cytochrome c family protein